MCIITQCLRILTVLMAASTRFIEPVSDVAEASLRAGAIPSNTKASTEWGIRVWEEWAACRKISTAGIDGVVPVNTPLLPADLAYWLGKFVLEVRKKDGSEYPPKSLYALICCFKRH